MLMLQTDIEGKKAYFGQMQDMLKSHGYVLGGNWEYERGCFDSILWREGGETIYMRVPFHVLDGTLDNYDTYIEFETPYVIKHVVNLGLDRDENSLVSTTGFNQFQEPLDTDGHIKNKHKWAAVGEQAIEQIVQNM